MANTYRDLLAWHKAKLLAVEVYRATERFPREELYGIVSQMRRAAVSVASNIAEGQGRGTKKDFASFLCVARGSLLELQTQIEIAEELGFIGVAESESLAGLCYAELGLLNRLMQALTSGQGGNKASK